MDFATVQVPFHCRHRRATRQEHAAVCFHIIDNALREPMERALEALVMEQQPEGKTKYPPFAQNIFERGKLEGFREGNLEGYRNGKLDGFRDGVRKGELTGKRQALLRLLARAGIPLTEDDCARILACEKGATLDRWVDNVLGAKTAADVLA